MKNKKNKEIIQDIADTNTAPMPNTRINSINDILNKVITDLRGPEISASNHYQPYAAPEKSYYQPVAGPEHPGDKQSDKAYGDWLFDTIINQLNNPPVIREAKVDRKSANKSKQGSRRLKSWFNRKTDSSKNNTKHKEIKSEQKRRPISNAKIAAAMAGRTYMPLSFINGKVDLRLMGSGTNPTSQKPLSIPDSNYGKRQVFLASTRLTYAKQKK